jgi:hypothetical protein
LLPDLSSPVPHYPHRVWIWTPPQPEGLHEIGSVLRSFTAKIDASACHLRCERVLHYHGVSIVRVVGCSEVDAIEHERQGVYLH